MTKPFATQTRSLASVVSPQKLGPLERLAEVLKLLTPRDEARAYGFTTGGADSTFDVGKADVLGVRAAKDRFSNILNDAANGQVTFVASGQGGTVAMIDADLLADVVLSMQAKSNLTLGDAFRIAVGPEPLEWREPRGGPSSHGVLEL